MLISAHLRPAYSKHLEPHMSKQLQSREVPQAAPPKSGYLVLLNCLTVLQAGCRTFHALLKSFALAGRTTQVCKKLW